MEALWDKIISEAGLIVLILLGAVAMLWRAYQKAQDNYTGALKENIQLQNKQIQDYYSFQNVISKSTEALEDNTKALADLERKLGR